MGALPQPKGEGPIQQLQKVHLKKMDMGVLCEDCLSGPRSGRD
jgi:hypothetical protein